MFLHYSLIVFDVTCELLAREHLPKKRASPSASQASSYRLEDSHFGFSSSIHRKRFNEIPHLFGLIKKICKVNNLRRQLTVDTGVRLQTVWKSKYHFDHCCSSTSSII